MTTHVWYHANCHDGLGAAWAAYQHFGDTAVYTPMFYNSPMPKVERGDEVVMVDYSRNDPEDVRQLLTKGVSVLILDHHQSAAHKYAPLTNELKTLAQSRLVTYDAKFDLDESGASLTWKHYHGLMAMSPLIEHIRDRDLWRFQLPRTKAIHAAMCSFPMIFRPDTIVRDGLEVKRTPVFDVAYRTLCDIGQHILRYHDTLVDKLCEEAFMARIGGYEVPMVNVSILFSEVPHRLLDLYPDARFAAYVYRRKDGWQYGLRGRGDFDVSTIAAKYGGGGHHNAAGFEINLEGNPNDAIVLHLERE